MTLDGFGSTLEPELAAAPVRLPAARAGDGSYRLTSRRRRGDAHRVAASVLAVLAIVGCVTAVLILAVEPTAARLQGQIGTLDGRLQAAESQLAAVQKAAVHAASQGSHLTKAMGLLSRHMTGLDRTVHGLQGSAAADREASDGLRACFAGLQQELSGLTLRSRSVHGHLTNVGLSESVGPSGACGTAFAGG
jgi:hypothetical protein